MKKCRYSKNEHKMWNTKKSLIFCFSVILFKEAYHSHCGEGTLLPATRYSDINSSSFTHAGGSLVVLLPPLTSWNQDWDPGSCSPLSLLPFPPSAWRLPWSLWLHKAAEKGMALLGVPSQSWKWGWGAGSCKNITFFTWLLILKKLMTWEKKQ